MTIPNRAAGTGYYEQTIKTREGLFRVQYSKRGLAALWFPDSAPATGRLPKLKFPPAINAWHKLTKAALKSVLAGKPVLKMPPLDLSGGTLFQQKIWRALRQIPRGQVRAYGELAAIVGRPKAARAVGAACGANPIPLLGPCHRVIASNGELGGFTSGLAWKRRLLAYEGLLQFLGISPPSINAISA